MPVEVVEIAEGFFNQRYLQDINPAKGNVFSRVLEERRPYYCAIAVYIQVTVLTAQSSMAGPYSREP